MVKNLTQAKIPSISWVRVKDGILGKSYDLSLVFLPDEEMARINSKYRRKKGPTNVLSFSLSEKSGEILIALPTALREAKTERKTAKEHVLFLYIHALLHLKGFSHRTSKKEKIMKKNEEKWLKILS